MLLGRSCPLLSTIFGILLLTIHRYVRMKVCVLILPYIFPSLLSSFSFPCFHCPFHCSSYSCSWFAFLSFHSTITSLSVGRYVFILLFSPSLLLFIFLSLLALSSTCDSNYSTYTLFSPALVNLLCLTPPARQSFLVAFPLIETVMNGRGGGRVR